MNNTQIQNYKVVIKIFHNFRNKLKHFEFSNTVM